MGWKVDLVVAKATAGEAWGRERILTGIFWCSLRCTWTGPRIGILKKFSLYFTVLKIFEKKKNIEKKRTLLKGVTIVVHCKNTFLSKKMLFGQKFLHLFFSSVHYLFKTPQMTSKPQFCFFPDSGEHFTYLDHGQKVKIHQNMTKGSFLDKSNL